MASTLVTTLFLLALASSSTAIPTPASLAQRPCVDFQIPVAVDTINQKWETLQVNSNADAVEFLLDLETWSSPNLTERNKGDITIQQTFSISARLCVPENGKKKDILQIVTHGVGYSKSYWDVELKPEKYSYVDAALDAGYLIMIYDRLGTGLSEKPDAYDIVQIPPQIEILKSAYSIGYSMGSIVTSGLLTRHPSAVDGAVLTGFLLSNGSSDNPDAHGLEFARASKDERFHNRPDGYVVQTTINDVQQLFFKQGYFEPDALAYAVSVKDTETVGEIVGMPFVTGLPAAEYSGPLLFANGEYDFAVCGGNCIGTFNIQAMKEALYPNATNVQGHIQPGSGHGLTLHANATGHFQTILNYLNDSGL